MHFAGHMFQIPIKCRPMTVQTEPIRNYDDYFVIFWVKGVPYHTIFFLQRICFDCLTHMCSSGAPLFSSTLLLFKCLPCSFINIVVSRLRYTHVDYGCPTLVTYRFTKPSERLFNSKKKFRCFVRFESTFKNLLNYNAWLYRLNYFSSYLKASWRCFRNSTIST